MPAQLALISVPRPERAVRLASALQSAGYDIILDALTDPAPFRDNYVQCAISGRDVADIYISPVAVIVTGLPELHIGTIPPDRISYDRCSLLVRAASSARKILVIAREADYERAIHEFKSPDGQVCEKTRLELCCWSLHVASTWLNHTSRHFRRQLEEQQAVAVA